jgi:hypothetical protein
MTRTLLQFYKHDERLSIASFCKRMLLAIAAIFKNKKGQMDWLPNRNGVAKTLQVGPCKSTGFSSLFLPLHLGPICSEIV